MKQVAFAAAVAGGVVACFAGLALWLPARAPQGAPPPAAARVSGAADAEAPAGPASPGGTRDDGNPAQPAPPGGPGAAHLSWDEVMTAAEQAAAEGRVREAALAYRAALEKAAAEGPNGTRYTRTLVPYARLVAGEAALRTELDALYGPLLGVTAADLATRPASGTELVEVARTLRHLGELDRARTLLARAAALAEEAFGSEAPILEAALSELAFAAAAAGDTGEAARAYRRAIDVSERSRGALAPATLHHLEALADLYRTSGDAGAADAVLRDLAQRQQAALAAGGPGAEGLETALARTRAQLGETDAAAGGYRAAAEAAAARPDAPLGERVAALRELARFEAENGRLEESRAALRAVAAAYEAEPSPRPVEVGRAWLDLGLRERELGDDAAAVGSLTRALAAFEAAPAEDRPSANERFEGLVRTTTALGRFEEAAAHYRDALRSEGRTASEAEVVERLAAEAHAIAATHPRQAAERYGLAVAVAEQALGPSDVTTTALRLALADALGATGRLEEAALAYERVLRTTAEAGRAPDAVVVERARALAEALRAAGRETAAAPLEGWLAGADRGAAGGGAQ